MAGVSKNNIRERLIDAGLKELLEHGYEDFSLRRVASSLEVSCASPYRYFKDKAELIHAAVMKLRENWLLLVKSIAEFSPTTEPTYVAELLVAGVRFWVAERLFAQLLSLGEVSAFDEPIISAIVGIADTRGISAENANALALELLALMYGEIALVLLGRHSASEAASIVRCNAVEKIGCHFDRFGAKSKVI